MDQRQLTDLWQRKLPVVLQHWEAQEEREQRDVQKRELLAQEERPLAVKAALQPSQLLM